MHKSKANNLLNAKIGQVNKYLNDNVVDIQSECINQQATVQRNAMQSTRH